MPGPSFPSYSKDNVEAIQAILDAATWPLNVDEVAELAKLKRVSADIALGYANTSRRVRQSDLNGTPPTYYYQAKGRPWPEGFIHRPYERADVIEALSAAQLALTAEQIYLIVKHDKVNVLDILEQLCREGIADAYVRTIDGKTKTIFQAANFPPPFAGTKVQFDYLTASQEQSSCA